MKYAVIILFLSTGFSTAADDEASKKLLKDLEGSYKITAAEESGKALSAPLLAAFEKVSIKGDKFSLTSKNMTATANGGVVLGKSETKAATIKVDASKKPAHVDLKPDEGDKKDETALGIIVIEGETIKICFNDETDKKRPTDFKTSKNDKYLLLTLKKTKD